MSILLVSSLSGKNAACVIMASGASKRFGSNKLMADFDGMPLIKRILDITEGCFTRRVVVTRHEEVRAYCAGRNVDCILHDLPYRSDTVRLGLTRVLESDRCMFCQSDQPLLSRETILSLLESAENDPVGIWRPRTHGEPGSPVLFPASLYPELLSLPEGKGGRYVIKAHPELERYLEISDARELMDVDTQEDLERLLCLK